MFDLQIIGSRIVEELSALIDENLIVIDHTGYIIASSDPNRLHDFHEGSLLAMEKKKIVHMTYDLTLTLKGVREGMVIPILVDDSTIGVIGVTGQPSNIEKSCKLIQKITQLFVEDFFARQEKERDYRLLELFMLDLLHNRLPTNTLLQRASALKINTANPYNIAVIQIERRFDIEELETWRSTQVIHPNVQIMQWSYDQLVLLIPASTREALDYSLPILQQKMAHQYKLPVKIGVGNSQAFHMLYHSFDLATIALQVASTINPIVFEEELKLELLLSDIHEDTAQQYLQRTLGPLMDKPELIQTLSTWLYHNDSLQQTADKLFIHRNTLKYRLKKIEKILDCNLKDTITKLELFMAIKLYEQQT